MTPPMRDRGLLAWGGLVAWTAGLGATVWVLTRLGTGALAAPPLGSVDALRAWAASRDAAEVVMAIVRLVALFMAWYLMALTVAGAFVRLFRSRRLVAVTDRVTPAAVRSLLDHAVRLGLTGTAVLGAIVPSVAGGRAPPVELAGAGQAELESTASQTRLDGTARQQRLTDEVMPPVAELAPTAGEPRPGGEPEPVAELEQPQPDEPAPDEPAASVWVIEAGDHLWRVAEETLTEAEGGPVDDASVVAYWGQLIELNREVLVDGDNPDLVYPGQVFALPPLPADGAQGR